MTENFRFDPPEVAPREELVWILRRAFGPQDADVAPLGSWARLVVGKLANDLDLGARIYSRNPAELIKEEIGPEATAGLKEAHSSAATVALIVDRICEEIASTVRSLTTRAVFLKGAALQLGGFVAAGTRSMGDVDVLVSKAAAPDLQNALIKRGAIPVDAPVSDHQMQWLKHPSGLGIEVHTVIPGVRFQGTASASIEDVLHHDAGRRLDKQPGEVYVPRAWTVMAHILVHGIAQHGLKPESYPAMRMLADLEDVMPERGRWDLALPEVRPWIKHDVSREEVNACRDLVTDLSMGVDPSGLLQSESPRGLYLRHVVAASTDRAYSDAIRIRSLARPVADGDRSKRLLRDAWRTVWLTDTQIEQIYGLPDSFLGYWARRLWRPFDLVGRTIRFGFAWARHRFRGKG